MIDAMPGLQHRYATELAPLCIPWRAAPVPQPALVVFNDALAAELGWPAERLRGPEGAALLCGQGWPPEVRTVAQGYAGHQFGGYVPRLGDGRALLLGEVLDRHGRLRDVALKGSGRTPFARGGDGKAALGPMLREYLISEAMHALGVPTSRSLAVVATGETIWREVDGLPQRVPGAVLVRVAASHIRVGTFQWVAASGDVELLRRLADHTLQRHDPGPHEQPYVALLEGACERQAALVAQWMGLGFIHGVMNTDNMTLSGETIDYGPCAFMEAFDPHTVFSSIDHGGRYAWGNQPRMAQWNLARLAEALLPLLHPDEEAALALAQAAIERFGARYRHHWLAIMRAKLGWQAGEAPPTDAALDGADQALIDDWLHLLHAQAVDWTLAHRRLSDLAAALDTQPARASSSAAQPLAALFADVAALDAWLVRWQARLQRNAHGSPTDWAHAMRCVNPIYIPRNQRVEEALRAASDEGDMAPFEALLSVVQQPFDERPGLERYAQPADPMTARRYRTFCGT